MVGLLQTLFHRQPRVVQLARHGDWPAFLRSLDCGSIHIVAALDSDGLDPATLTQEALLAAMERAARDLKDRTNGFEPFVYEREGRLVLPFFTSEQYAQTFAREYSREQNRVYAFQVLGVQGSVLAQLLPACDLLIMNDRS